jgi:hypothetical protein
MYIDNLINDLAHKRGYFPPNRKFFYIPIAPPRETLCTFCGPEGLSIEQFRGLCAAGFDVNVLHPPYITEKQVIVAECERMSKLSKLGRLVHVDDVNCLMVPAAEFAKRKRVGLEIFAGVGAKRLTDFIGKKTSVTSPTSFSPLPPPPPPSSLFRPLAGQIPTAAQAQPIGPGTARSQPIKNGRIKRPLPITNPQAVPLTKRPRSGDLANKKFVR